MGQTMEHRWHEVRRERCEASEAIRLQDGVGSAFGNVGGEKLLTFAEAGERHLEFARELPQFVSDMDGAPGMNREWKVPGTGHRMDSATVDVGHARKTVYALRRIMIGDVDGRSEGQRSGPEAGQ